MDNLINFLLEQIEWVFSGIGVFIIGLFVYKKYSSKQNTQNQKVSKNSNGIQVNGDLNINSKNK